MTKKWYEERETGVPTYPRYRLTHYNGSKGWNCQEQKAELMKIIDIFNEPCYYNISFS